MNKTQLVDRLLEEGVPLSKWGSDVTKKIDRLAKQIEIYGARISKDDLGRLTLGLPVVDVDFLHNNWMLVRMGKIVRLGIRPMGDVIGSSIRVPLQKGTTPLDTAFDATRSLFCLKSDASFYNFNAYPVKTEGAMFEEDEYPGLRVAHIVHAFEWNVPLEHYERDGYCDKNHISYWWLNLTDVKTLDMKAVMRAISEAQL